MKLFLKIILGLFAAILLTFIAFVQIIDRTPYQEMPYYKDWKNNISEISLADSISKDSLLVGWAKVNITPQNPVPLAGYGKRKGVPYKDVHDSVFVRTLFLENSGVKAAIVSVDLLIVPPTISNLVKTRISETGLTIEQVYFGATHSHNSLGGWYNTFVGKLFAGKYDPSVEQLIAEGILNSIKLASQNTQPGIVSFEKDFDSNDIKNRLVDDGLVEPYIRSLVFQTKLKKAILTTYSAHSTVLNASTVSLSRDFPGVLVDSLEKGQADFAIYLAGTVGSMAPLEIGVDDFDEVNNQANGVLAELLSANEFESTESKPVINSFQLPLPLRKASPRISKNLALRPWGFRWIFGESPAYVKVLKIGSNLLIGMPCDFSGELMKTLDEYAASKKLNLIITSFNGSYIGYITADEHFDMEAYETYTMSWFGPYNGAYFSEVVKDIIDVAAKK